MAAMDALEILRGDADEWKKRALEAQEGIRALAPVCGLAFAAFRAWKDEALDDEGSPERFSRYYPELTVALEELFAGLEDWRKGLVEAAVEAVPAFDVFDQVTEKLSVPIAIRRVKALGCVSTLSSTPNGRRLIQVDADVPPAAQGIGVLFQLLQLADMATLETDPERAAPMVSPSWIQERAPALLVLLAATGFLNPELPFGVEDVAALDAKP